ncbi:hypothetical protein HHK36_018092 [Tetracentron sinense]|uniref:Mitochondrial import inner membrane translocase subunit TIM50 n=1 Tax=Tetracentron sinense TaxID=13715 RepID=A0A835DDP1_TETSI|nr:hypothetical protein HHK36_018092 [Tetracentron sinense]
MSERTSRARLKMARYESDESDDDYEVDKGDDCGVSLEKLNIGPRKKLLVLNMGGLLLHRVHRSNKASIKKSRKCDLISGNFQVFKRPFCDDFVKFCFEKFEVGLWSSAMWWNVDNVLKFAIGTLRPKLLFTWDQGECTETGFKALENREKPIFLKELKKLWDKDKFSLPWPKGRYSSSNTLLIDDTPNKSLLNPSNTAIFPHQYDANDTNDKTLGPNGELRLFLEGLADAEDVPTYVKEHPIGQPEITSMHPDWKFYSKIIDKFRNQSSSPGRKDGSSTAGTNDGSSSAGRKD